jgi:hypothetical protein
MYYIASKDKNDEYYIDEEAVVYWHDAIDNFEPIDCISGEIIIYDEYGHKYFIGPNKDLSRKKMFWNIYSVDVGNWNFENGEPFLVDTKEVVPNELQALLNNFK